MSRRFSFLWNHSRKWRIGMVFVAALVLLFAIMGVTGMAAEPDDGPMQEVPDGFSYYQVEFTYDGKQYVLPGDESVALTEILDFVGITNADGGAAKDADITAAKGSETSCLPWKRRTAYGR